MDNQFKNKKEFADFISRSRGKVISWNKQSGDSRIHSLASWMEYLNKYEYLKGAQGTLLGNTMYGLTRFLDSGRANHFAHQGLCAMNARQLCELVYTLTEQSHDIEEHCRILNLRYAQKAGVIK
jgi:hypothetical protein